MVLGRRAKPVFLEKSQEAVAVILDKKGVLMSFLALLLIISCFFKSFYYGIYEIKTRKNKSGGIAVCLFAILRTYLSMHCHFLALYFISFMVLSILFLHTSLGQTLHYTLLHQKVLAFVL